MMMMMMVVGKHKHRARGRSGGGEQEEEEERLVEYEQDGDIAVITLLGELEEERFGWGTKVCEHRIGAKLVQEMNQMLDEVEGNEQVRAVVVTGDGKYFCNGMDVKWIEGNLEQVRAFQKQVEMLMGRILSFPVPTVAAINGHVTGAGVILSLCFDYRVMYEDRGYLFVPVLDLGLVLTSGMHAVLRSKLCPRLHRDIVMNNRRFTGADLLEIDVVDRICTWKENELVLELGLDFARSELLQKDRFKGNSFRQAVHENKLVMYANAHALLTGSENDDMGFEHGRWNDEGVPN